MVRERGTFLDDLIFKLLGIAHEEQQHSPTLSQKNAVTKNEYVQCVARYPTQYRYATPFEPPVCH